MRVPSRLLTALVSLVLMVQPFVGPDEPAPAPASEGASTSTRTLPGGKEGPQPSGTHEHRGEQFAHGITECPQAALRLTQPRPLDHRQQDRVEQVSQTGDDSRANDDYSCFPQNETSIAVNPLDPRNAVSGANDYRLGWGTSGVYATTDNGNHWYNAIIPFPSLPDGDNLDGGGDPAIAFDREGVAYYVEINFNRTDDTNGIFTSRSTNGGFTWTRMCVPVDATPADPTDDRGRCGGPGDPRQPGDGVVAFEQDSDRTANGSVPFNDKEYVAVGPRPAGVEPVCFGAFTRNPRPCDPDVVGVDRVHVTWTLFEADAANIYYSYSDDQGRSWSRPRAISGSAPFCAFGAGNSCDFNQFSTPTVNPVTGHLYVSFENFNTPDENQYLLVRSRDGGQTFEGPFFVTPVYDVNYPRAGAGGGRPDCTARGQQNGRRVLTNSCFRVNAGGNVVADRRGGEFADDLYLVMSDNRNGTRASSNTDVFLFASKDGGSTWIGPTRVNSDPSRTPEDRDCPRAPEGPCSAKEAFGNDQWFPWVDISPRGDLNIVFSDRRLDVDSVASEWPSSRQRPGNYLSWLFGAQCSITTTGTVTGSTTTVPAAASQCLARSAGVIPQPTAPVDPGPGPAPTSDGTTLRNFTISDVPSNYDYAFRAGIFMGDYNNVAIGPDGTAWSMWTDARNGRSSRDQAGRNPACEQSDVMVDLYSAQSGGTVSKPKPSDAFFLVAPCPTDVVAPGGRSS